MGKKKANTGALDEDAAMDMSPMIDMVFLLIIFFVVNATAITVKLDAAVKMPVATNSGEIKNAKGYIVVNLYGDTRPKGVSSDVMIGDDASTPLMTDEAISDYIKGLTERYKSEGIEPEEQKLYIRGDQKSVFKYSRKLIKIAGSHGVAGIVFGVNTPSPKAE